MCNANRSNPLHWPMCKVWSHLKQVLCGGFSTLASTFWDHAWALCNPFYDFLISLQKPIFANHQKNNILVHTARQYGRTVWEKISDNNLICLQILLSAIWFLQWEIRWTTAHQLRNVLWGLWLEFRVFPLKYHHPKQKTCGSVDNGNTVCPTVSSCYRSFHIFKKYQKSTQQI